ncbi:MAG TPA: ribonuclease D [Sedimenticola sp.]|nr:ribonuclease D [Sedimenticola sp.]
MQELFADTPDRLERLCSRLAGSEWLALDTEFLREKTYYPRFCLLQVSNGETAACVDPLRIDDLSPLRALLDDPAITKVFHAGRQDLEIFHQLWGTLPAPLFDTQLAATLTGYGDQVGYAALVKRLLAIDLEKGQARTDWSLRPLAPEQRRYALDDVIYLGEIYLRLKARLEELGRIRWLDDDFAALAAPASYEIDPTRQWRRIRGHQHLKGVQLAVLQALAAWRENLAMASDRPKNWILKDEVLLELARRMPKDKKQLGRIRGLERGAVERRGDELLGLIAEARRLPAGQWPQEEALRVRPTPEQEALTDILMCALRLRAEEQRLSPQALASRKNLEQLAAGNRDLDLLKGWRRAVVGADLLRVLEGKLWPRLKNGRLELAS